MGRASKRKRAGAPVGNDIHQRVLDEAQRAREAARYSARDAAETPALAQLFDAARAAVEAATPTKFAFEGRVYWLRVSPCIAKIEVFDAPGTAKALVTGALVGGDQLGHTPGH